MRSIVLDAARRASRYCPVSFEAFILGGRTILLDPLEASTLDGALAETTGRWAWDRGSRLGVRELGEKTDKLHVYAVRRASVGERVWSGYSRTTEYRRWLDHICTIDLKAVAGIAVGAVGCEVDLHEHRQRRRPEGARLTPVAEGIGEAAE